MRRGLQCAEDEGDGLSFHFTPDFNSARFSGFAPVVFDQSPTVKLEKSAQQSLFSFVRLVHSRNVARLHDKGNTL